MSRMYEIAFGIMNSTFSSASERMTQFNTQVKSLKAEMKNLDGQCKKNAISVLEYSASYEKLTAKMYKAEQHQKSYEKAFSLQKKVEQSRTNAKNNIMGGIGAAKMISGPIFTAMSFESVMSDVAKQIDGARNDAGQLTDVYDQAQNRVMQASKDMSIGPENMAKAFAAAAKSGVQGVENIDKFARMGTMMGKAFKAPAEQVGTDFARIGSNMGLNLQTSQGMAQLEALADTVNYLNDRTHVAGTDMISVLKDTSTNAASILPTLSQTTLAGMSAALLHMGESSDASGSALNTLFTKVSNAPAQSESFQAALAQLGMSAEELQSGALTNAEGTMMNLFECIQGLDGASKKNVLAELFGPENIDNISKISGSYEDFLRVMKMGNADAAKGSLAKGFEIQSQSPERKQEGLQAAIARMEINVGQPVLPDFASLLGSLSKAADWIGEVSKEYPALSSAAFKLTGAVVGTSVALSTLAWVGWSIISPFASIYEWSKRMELAARLNTGAQWAWTAAQRAWNTAVSVGKAALGVGQFILRAAWTGIVTVATWAWTAAQWAWNAAMAANPIGLVIAGIALLVGAGYWLVSNWTTVQAWWTQLWNDPLAALQSFINEIYNRFSPVINWLRDRKKEFKNFFGGGGILYDANDHIGPKVAMQVPTQAHGAVATAPGIPLNGTPQAMALATTTGHMMDGGTPFNEFLNGTTGRDQREEINFAFNPSIYLNGGDANVESKLRQVIQDQVGDFESRMTAFMEQQRRLDYA